METFEIQIEEIGVTQLYLNQRKLGAVKDQTAEEEFKGFPSLPVYDFGDGKPVLTDGHHRLFQLWQSGAKTVEVHWDKDPNVTSKLPQRMYRMELDWCRDAGINNITDLKNRILQASAYEFFWLERCRRGYNLITTRNKQALDKARELAPEMKLYGTERNLQSFYFEDAEGALFKYYDGDLRRERSDNH